jgi:hypothetical protein
MSLRQTWGIDAGDALTRAPSPRFSFGNNVRFVPLPAAA